MKNDIADAPSLGRLELRALQCAVSIAGCVPVTAGLAGVLLGQSLLNDPLQSASLDSHVRYLSGLLLGIGLASWALVPTIRTATIPFRLITFLVVVGGLARLGGIWGSGMPAPPMLFGLGMELGVTPLLCLWQWRVARLSQSIC